MLTMAQIDDLTGEADPVNVPTTSTEHPNWRRRLCMTLAELADDPEFNDIAEIFNRGTSVGDRRWLPRTNGESPIVPASASSGLTRGSHQHDVRESPESLVSAGRHACSDPEHDDRGQHSAER